MDTELKSGEVFVNTYKSDVIKLARYIPWLAEKSGKDVAETYTGEYGNTALTFPVYDGTLLSFVKDAQNTKFMDKNYLYSYSHGRLKSPADERRAIENAELKDVDLLRGILSRYVLEGMVKSRKWTQGVEEKIFLGVLSKLKELVEFYGGPLER